MKEVTKEQWLSSVTDLEKLYLIQTDNGKVYLLSDIEYGGDMGLRIEMMYFEMNTERPFSTANSECRGHYTGGITFIEYNTKEEADRYVLTEFLDLKKNAIYLLCSECEFKEVSQLYLNNIIYISIPK